MIRIRRWAVVLGLGVVALAIVGMFADRSAGLAKAPPIQNADCKIQLPQKQLSTDIRLHWEYCFVYPIFQFFLLI